MTASTVESSADGDGDALREVVPDPLHVPRLLERLRVPRRVTAVLDCVDPVNEPEPVPAPEPPGLGWGSDSGSGLSSTEWRYERRRGGRDAGARRRPAYQLRRTPSLTRRVSGREP